MAPRKKTEEKASANEAADMVLHYLRRQNRPYSAIDVSANLHNKVTKVVDHGTAAAAKVLKDLHEQKQIEGRPAGKQIVYHALQNAEDSCTPEQLAALDAQITDLRTNTTNLLGTIKILRSTLSSLNSTLSTTDLVSNVHALESEQVEILARLENLKAGKAKKVTEVERMDVERQWKKGVGVAKRREKIAREMWKLIADQLPDQELREELREAFDLDG
ncbi:Tat binding protein 1-interacting [Cucurbitaria berberidis CBS 394.84]|uniref:Tat binding protein 1-interacting n=1 Tax=Cucurbitaria berberidis CBS 394.84 TaxID=1168544 RepID=A0A9P4GEM8_9PLEO|nr:Tat binding protein 1-interacting [Cucurbitaria berberidis CBS 394.84]KAF1843896.1 Tat binding protein 1-interacting [Cucurbitaria berberidis CBS 394.84]